MQNVGGVKYQWLDIGTPFLRKCASLTVYLSILTMALTSVAKVSQLYTRTRFTVNFRSV